MTDDELKELFGGLRQDTTALRQDNASIREEIGALRQDNVSIREEIGALRQDNVAIRQEAVVAHEETRRHFDVALNDMRGEIQLVAESAVHTREEVRRAVADFREMSERGHAETQAMIKFSHSELDRRMRTLEDAVADLQARVERLESSTH